MESEQKNRLKSVSQCPGCGAEKAIVEFECFYFYQVGLVCIECKLCIKAEGLSVPEAVEELEVKVKQISDLRRKMKTQKAQSRTLSGL